MKEERWGDLVEQIKQRFTIKEHGREADESGVGITEFIIFESPRGLMMLEMIVKPRVIDTKRHFSKRAGAETVVENVYDKVDKIRTLKVYEWIDQDDDWREIRTDDLMSRL